MGMSPQSTFYDPVLLIRITSVRVLSYCATLSDTLGRNEWSELQRVQPDMDGPRTYLRRQARLFIQEAEECRDTNVILHPFERLTAQQCLYFLDSYLRRDNRTVREKKAIRLLNHLINFRVPSSLNPPLVNHRRLRGDFGGLFQYPPTPPFEHDSVIPDHTL